MEYKICSKCKRKLPKTIEYFEKRKTGSKDGFRGQCRTCRNKIRTKGITKLLEANPNIDKYLVNQEDGLKYSYSSNKKIKVKCPICGYEKEMAVNDLYFHGFGCNVCSDRISLGEKVLSNILDQLGYKNKYKREKIFTWAKGKRYDFYIPSLCAIIEVHGLQHYKETNIGRKHGRAYKDERENDILKKELALSNNIKHYIIVDCRYSSLQYIKQSVLANKELREILDINNVNWDKVLDYTNYNYIKKSADLYKQGKSVVGIARELNVNRSTVREWLKSANFLGLCEYNEVAKRNFKYTENNKKIPKYDKEIILKYYLNTQNIQTVAKILNCHEDTVRRVVREKSKNNECVYNGKENQISCRCKKVKNTKINKVYKSITEASKVNNIPTTTLRRYCNNKKNKEWIFIE